nr:DUF3558 domain-containing protein [Saccharomonospora viridis]
MMRMPGAVLAGAVVLLVAGCSATSDGVASPTPQDSAASQSVSSSSSESQSPGGGQLPHSGAPAVSDPLPESVLAIDPCEVLTRDQVEEMLGDDAPEGQRNDLKTGPSCDWQDPKSGAGFSVYLGTETRQGLSGYYQNTKPQAGIWREVPEFHGFPAVVSSADESPYTSCHMAVGLADEYTISVGVTLSRDRMGKGDKCEPVQKLAEMLVENLKERAGR